MRFGYKLGCKRGDKTISDMSAERPSLKRHKLCSVVSDIKHMLHVKVVAEFIYVLVSSLFSDLLVLQFV